MLTCAGASLPSQGLPLLLENVPAELDAVLDPVLGKATVKRGRALVMKIGDAEVEYDANFRWAASRVVKGVWMHTSVLQSRVAHLAYSNGFRERDSNTCPPCNCLACRLYLQTKLSNPHYKPEIAAQCTLVNFCVTEKVGLVQALPLLPVVTAQLRFLITASVLPSCAALPPVQSLLILPSVLRARPLSGPGGPATGAGGEPRAPRPAGAGSSARVAAGAVHHHAQGAGGQPAGSPGQCTGAVHCAHL